MLILLGEVEIDNKTSHWKTDTAITRKACLFYATDIIISIRL